MKTACRERKPLGKNVQQPSTWCGRSKQILLIQGGCEEGKIPDGGEIFFLV
jgi:hypothetical protein